MAERINPSILHSSELKILETNCNLILQYDDVKFVGVINFLGNLIAGGFKEGVTPIGDENTRRMIYMQIKLDLTMRQEWDELFGSVDYVISKRGKITKISIPVSNYMILLITNNSINYKSVIKKINTIFKSSLKNF